MKTTHSPMDLFWKFKFGKYKEKQVKDIAESDPQYIKYLQEEGMLFTKRVLDYTDQCLKVKTAQKWRDYHNSFKIK